MDTIKTIADLLKLNGSVQNVMVSLTPSEQRLIAAAPELLEALKSLADDVYRLSGHALSPKTEPIMVQACAAITKAEGRES